MGVVPLNAVQQAAADEYYESLSPERQAEVDAEVQAADVPFPYILRTTSYFSLLLSNN